MNFLIRNIRGAFALCAGKGRYQNARSNLRLGLPEERTGIIVEPSRIWRLVQIEKISTMNPVGQGIHSPSKVSRVMNKSARFATQWNSSSFRDEVSQLAMRTFSEDLEGRRLNRSSKKRVHCSTSKGGKVSRLSFLSKGALAGVLVLCSCAVSFAQLGRDSGVPVRQAVVAAPASEAVPVTRKKYIGNVEAIEQVDSVARVSGTLSVAPGFEEGSHVSKGQLLFTIDDTPYKAQVDACKAAIQETEARIAYAQSNFNRLNSLFEKNAGSQDDKESAEANLRSLNALLASAQAKLTLAEEDLKYTKIYSEIDGRAGRRTYSSGNYVTPQSQSLLRVVQMDPIYVRFTMSERDFLNMFGNLKSLKESSSIELTLSNGTTYSHKGEVCFIDNSVKSTTDTIKIWAKFSNPEEILNPGGVVTVNLAKTAEKPTASVLPSAVMFDGKTNYVYVLVDSIDDETLFNEISADPRFANALEAVTKGEKSKEEFLKEFKQQRYEYVDPKDKSEVRDLDNGKVNEKYLLTLRRNVELGPSDGSIDTILKGIKPGEIVMMDGVNKARPFDLVRPVYRDAAKASEPQQKVNASEKQAVRSTNSKVSAPASAKRADAKKPNLAHVSFQNEGVNA